MKARNKGFTLIELVVVIVILGILAAVALPRFINLQDEANAAALSGVAGAISSAAAINYGARKANAAKGVAINAAGACSTTNANNLLTGGLPTGYSITAGAGGDDCSVANADGTTRTCTISKTGYTPTTSATIICVNP